MDYEPIKLKIAVLYDGGGLARKGLEDAGHECVGVELNPVKHKMSKYVGSGNSILANVLELDDSFYHQFDAVWSSPPCQSYSDQKVDDKIGEFGNPECLPHSMTLAEKYPHLKAVWVENVFSDFFIPHATRYNAAQFLSVPTQRRRRLIGGSYRKPKTLRPFKYDYVEFRRIAPPACLASEIGHGGLSKNISDERRKFTRWYLQYKKRRPTINDMAIAQGFIIPDEWSRFDDRQISQAIGNGVPVYMSRAFGEAYSKPETIKQSNFFELVDAV